MTQALQETLIGPHLARSVEYNLIHRQERYHQGLTPIQSKLPYQKVNAHLHLPSLTQGEHLSMFILLLANNTPISP